MDYNHFFMCGVPGGVDYLLLFLVKHSWMAPLEEKRIATIINVWFRAPWLVSVACFGYIQFFIDNTPLHIFLFRCFLLMLAAWNGLFFMERVVGNFHVNRYKQKQQKTGSPDADAQRATTSTGEDQDYETDEHVLPSAVIPQSLSRPLGLTRGNSSRTFNRVAVSHQDLLAASPSPAHARRPVAPLFSSLFLGPSVALPKPKAQYPPPPLPCRRARTCCTLWRSQGATRIIPVREGLPA